MDATHADFRHLCANCGETSGHMIAMPPDPKLQVCPYCKERAALPENLQSVGAFLRLIIKAQVKARAEIKALQDAP